MNNSEDMELILQRMEEEDDDTVKELQGVEDEIGAEKEIDIYRKEYFNKKEQESDYEYSRRTLLDLISRGAEGVDEALRIAQETEHPRAFEVLFKGIKDIADTNEKLVDFHKKQKEIDKIDRPQIPKGGLGEGETIQMTTDALQRLLSKNEKNKTSEEKEITPEPEIIENAG